MAEAIGRFHALMAGHRVKYVLAVNGKPVLVEIDPHGSLLLNGKKVDAELLSQAGPTDLVRMGKKRHQIYLRKVEGHTYEVWINHYVISVNLSDERDQLLARYRKGKSAEKSLLTIRAPMPGIVTKLHAAAGEIVESGDGLVILEAMKMENEIRSPHAGRVKSVMVKEKTTVEKDQPLLSIEPV
ncbi:MAG TPA: acetyl-CoA carboxylase biotin carboxyl carrier protein subunit [Bacteroidota bacterium]|jgi:biotin carboxyl carrier protein